MMRDKHSTSVTDDQIQKIKHAYQRKLKNLGWTSEYIEFYNECRVNVISFKIYCEQYFPYVLLLWYSWLLYRFNHNASGTPSDSSTSTRVVDKRVNKHARNIIDDIVRDAIDKQISYNLENIGNQTMGYSVLSNYSFQPSHIRYEVLGGMDNLFDKLYNILTEQPIPHVIREEVGALLMLFLALLKPNPLGLRSDIYRVDTFRFGLRIPILPTLNSNSKEETQVATEMKVEPTVEAEQTQAIKKKIARYQELLAENRQFVEDKCKEYYEKSLKEIEEGEVLSFTPDYTVYYSSPQPVSYDK
jgi:hypothetical protein